jgi:hypothetical protein
MAETTKIIEIIEEKEQIAAAAVPRESAQEGRGQPGEDFNRQATVESVTQMLVDRGYTPERRNGGGKRSFTRSGKSPREGTSGTLFEDRLVYYNFSSNDPFLAENEGYSPFGLYAQLEHSGNYSAAAKGLSREGYGDPPEKQKSGDRDTGTPLGSTPTSSTPEAVMQTEQPARLPEENTLARMVLDFQAFNAIEFLPRKSYLGPWLMEQSIGMVYAWRGGGKTFFGLGVLDAVTKGTGFGPWTVGDEPVPTLLLDAEMPSTLLQGRSREMGIGQGTKAPAMVLSMDYAVAHGLPMGNLLSEQWRNSMTSILLAAGVKLFLLDNVSSLSPFGDENSKEPWAPVNQWLLFLRFRGISTLLFHHAGKSGTQRGFSGREDNLDTTIVLKQPASYRITDGCKFTCHFEKNRVEKDLHLLEPITMTYQGGIWTYTTEKQQAVVKNVKGKLHNALEILRKLYKKQGKNLAKSGRPAEEANVLYIDWREACNHAGLYSRSDAFGRAVETLLVHGLIKFDEKRVFVYPVDWLTKTDSESY